jgi:hypothetical protein
VTFETAISDSGLLKMLQIAWQQRDVTKNEGLLGLTCGLGVRDQPTPDAYRVGSYCSFPCCRYAYCY